MGTVVIVVIIIVILLVVALLFAALLSFVYKQTEDFVGCLFNC